MYLDVEIEGDDDSDYDDAKIYQQRLQWVTWWWKACVN